ncbi:MAG: polysaccharide deacetylase family protein [Planctomycetota bacterium]
MRIPILVYHAVLPVDRTGRVRGTVPLRDFEEQVQWLQRRGYTSLSLDQAADMLEGTAPPVRRGVVITFDDGYRCVHEHALPVLREAGFTATLFVVTDVVGGRSDWYVAKGGRAFDHADWSELESATADGFAIGSHTVRHRRLTDLTEAELEDELVASGEAIRRRLGRCDHFAYPFGGWSEALAAKVLESGYRTACTTESGANRTGQSLGALRRQGVSRTTTGRRFRRRMGAWV